MAIIPAVPGLEVTIRLNGIEATEFIDPDSFYVSDDSQNDTIITGRVLEYNSTGVSVHIKITDEYEWDLSANSLDVAVYMNGRWAKGTTCGKADIQHGDWECEMSLVDTTHHIGSTQEDFKSSLIDSAENINGAKYTGAVEGLEKSDIIEVKVQKAVGESHNDNVHAHSPLAVPCGYSIITFLFSCLTREAIMRMGIIPRPTYPIRKDPYSTTPAALQGLSQEEIEALALEMLQQFLTRAPEAGIRYQSRERSCWERRS
ncbi:hypothetical protein GGS23DRAFT_535435 [Durotheca rogersii]|uniref:uncharacterized protein n=1 Tax=Durotheca rogersii TaxID=419775 RepID=UPI00222124F2|nr:uncharacterized protein GGS23DRAFT_535435 [Durotheca rogersii]KAI5863463.1 hypothetical protein GGS23DRAFT_535435 [Durotheca rogersii]